ARIRPKAASGAGRRTATTAISRRIGSPILSPTPSPLGRGGTPGALRLPGLQAAWHGAGNRSGSGGAGGDGALAGRTAGPPDGQQGGKGAGAGVIPGRSPDRPQPASGAGEQAPPRSAAVSARQSSPLPIVPQRERTPGALRLPGLHRLQRRGAL